MNGKLTTSRNREIIDEIQCAYFDLAQNGRSHEFTHKIIAGLLDINPNNFSYGIKNKEGYIEKLLPTLSQTLKNSNRPHYTKLGEFVGKLATQELDKKLNFNRSYEIENKTNVNLKTELATDTRERYVPPKRRSNTPVEKPTLSQEQIFNGLLEELMIEDHLNSPEYKKEMREREEYEEYMRLRVLERLHSSS